MSKFGERLRSLRNDRGMTQQQLGDRLNISKSSINMYERGDREPGFETLEAIADFFNVDMNYLYGKSDIRNSIMIDTPTSPKRPPSPQTDDDPLAGALFAAYGEVKEEFDEDDIEDVKMFMRVVAERKRQRAEKNKK